jgi:hypothetical protein
MGNASGFGAPEVCFERCTGRSASSVECIDRDPSVLRASEESGCCRFQSDDSASGHTNPDHAGAHMQSAMESG